MSDKNYLPAVELNPASPPTAAVIWLHGLGADGHDFEPIPPELGLPKDLAVRFVFPHAPKIPVTINMGFVMPAWYDIKSLSLDQRGQDVEGIEKSAAAVRRLIEREIEHGIPANRIVVAGFSQGGAIALHTGLRYPEKLAGVMCLSAYLLLHERLADDASPVNQQTSIFQAHGTQDPTVPVSLGKMTRDHLQRAGYDVQWNEYPMGHSVNMQEILDIGRWLTDVLS